MSDPPDPGQRPELITRQEFARRLGVKESTTKEYQRSRCPDPIPANCIYKIGRRPSFNWNDPDLHAWIARRREINVNGNVLTRAPVSVYKVHQASDGTTQTTEREGEDKGAGGTADSRPVPHGAEVVPPAAPEASRPNTHMDRKKGSEMRASYQRGHICRNASKKNPWWMMHCRIWEWKDGELRRVHKAIPLAPIDERHSTKESVRYLADRQLAPLNDGTHTPHSSMTIEEFVESVFMPNVAERCWNPSTRGTEPYRLRKYILPYCGQMHLGEFQPHHAQQFIDGLADTGQLSEASLRHVRHLLSGIFSEAIRRGFLANRQNPVAYVRIPKVSKLKPPRLTYAYNLSQIQAMLNVLGDPDRTIVALLAFAGLRVGELIALHWEDWDGRHIVIWKSDWEGHITETKTRRVRKIPVIPNLSEILMQYRLKLGNPQTGRMFEHHGGRVSLRNRAKPDRPLRRILAEIGVPWWSWYAFRRGLATNLAELGVSISIIQRILGHSSSSTTERHYVKVSDGEVDAAMDKLYQAWISAPKEEGDAPIRAQ